MAKYSYEPVNEHESYVYVYCDGKLFLGAVTKETAKLIVDALNAYTPPLEPVPCVCGSRADVFTEAGGGMWYATCLSVNGHCYWRGGGHPTREQAIEAVRQLAAMPLVQGVSHETIRSWIEEGRE